MPQRLIFFFNEVGFPVNKYSRVIKNIDDCLSYFDEMNNLRNNIPYEIDGLVYRVNDFQYYKSLGFTSKSPKWAIAYKFKSQESLSQIEMSHFKLEEQAQSHLSQNLLLSILAVLE